MDSDLSAASYPAANPAPALQREHDFEFRGSGGEYFRIWIVNLLLTIITFGIYGAWAKVRRLRYFYGSTVLAGSSFEYHGLPTKILKGRLIAGALIAPYYLFQRTYPLVALAFVALFLIALPFIIVQSRRFQTRVSSWRNVHFGFDGRYGAAARVYLGLSLLVPFTLGLLLPYVQFAKQRFVIGETRFGGTKFEFSARPGPYYRAYLAALGWFLLSLLVGVIVITGLIVVIGIVAGISGAALFSNPRAILNSPAMVTAAAIIFAVFYAGILAVMLVPSAVAAARITNEALSNTRVGGHQLRSDLSAKSLVGIYLSNLLLIVVTLGLFSPWAKVRLLRYQLEHLHLIASGDLDEFVNAESELPSATGEELGDFLDVDFGL